MKKILYILFFVAVFSSSCTTKWEYVDTGLAHAHLDKTMWEYFGTDSYNWDSIKLIITRADLEDVFNGTSTTYGNDITFFGPANHVIRKWMFDKKINSISDISKEDCQKYVLAHLLKGAVRRDDFPRGVQGTSGNKGTGGQEYTFEGGNEVWIFSYREAYDKVPDAGAVTLTLWSKAQKYYFTVASSDILTASGVVHSLSYKYQFPKIQ